MRISWCIWLLLFSVSFGFSQEKPTATKIDEFGRITCEDMLARIYNLHAKMQDDPSALGLFILAPHHDRFRKLIERTFQRNEFDSKRMRILFRPNEKSVGTIWLFQPGASVPFSDMEIWPLPPDDFSEAFIWDTFIDDGVCPTFAPSEYARILKTVPKIRGHVVVNAANRQAALASGSEWIKQLTEKWGVPRKSLKLFVGKHNKVLSSTDFWIVPSR